MNDKNLPPDNNLQSLEDLTNEANNIIETLEEYIGNLQQFKTLSTIIEIE